jgi:hypothetical protein
MSLFNSITRGFGLTLGRKAADAVTTPNAIDKAGSFVWKLIKWLIIITFLFGVLEGLMS